MAPLRPRNSTTRPRLLFAAAVFSSLAAAIFLLISARYHQSARNLPPHLRPTGKSDATGTAALLYWPVQKVIQVATALDPILGKSLVLNSSTSFLDTKTPCWLNDQKHNCLPYAYLAGSFQAGVNSMLAKMKLHSDVVTNDITQWQFWGEEPQAKSFSEYVKKGGESFGELQKKPGSKVLLDASSSTFAFYWSAGLRTHQGFQNVMKPCWSKCSSDSKGNLSLHQTCMAEICYPKSLNADQQVAEDLGLEHMDLQLPLLMAAAYSRIMAPVDKTKAAPYTKAPKIIILIRNPVERIHSAYWSHPHYKGKYGETAEGFLSYVKEQVGALKNCEAKGFGTEECALYFEALGTEEEQLFFHADQFIRGMYALFLELWMRHFPREHFLIIKSEEYFTDPDAIMQKVFTFLEVDRAEGSIAKAISESGKPRSSSQGKPAMLKEARDILTELYRPWNMRLAALLGDEYFKKWNS